MKKIIKENALYGAFAVALLALFGSLYFSEIAHFPPCVLCWYQRIGLYPLVVIFGFAIYRKSKEILYPSYVLVAIAWVIGLYHNLLYYNIIPEAAAPCTAGISCTTKFIAWGGFITIPLLAFVGSTVIGILLIINWRNSKND